MGFCSLVGLIQFLIYLLYSTFLFISPAVVVYLQLHVIMRTAGPFEDLYLLNITQYAFSFGHGR